MPQATDVELIRTIVQGSPFALVLYFLAMLAKGTYRHERELIEATKRAERAESERNSAEQRADKWVEIAFGLARQSDQAIGTLGQVVSQKSVQG